MNERPIVFVTGKHSDNLFEGLGPDSDYFYQDATTPYVNKSDTKCIRCKRMQPHTIVWRNAIKHQTFCLDCVATTSAMQE